MRGFLITENTAGTEKVLVKLGLRRELFTTEDTEGTEKKRKEKKRKEKKPEEKKPEEKKPEKVASVPSVFSVVNDFLETANGRLTRRQEWQPCS